MSGLMKQVEQRRQLPKAGDADRDPADLTASQRAGEAAGDTATIRESKNASISASRNAGTPAVASASPSAAGPAARSASRKTVKKANSGDRQRPAGRKRRVGRPLGPNRTAITVRILSEIDDALTAAVEASGQSPQYIVDDALRGWLTQHGYLHHHS